MLIAGVRFAGFARRPLGRVAPVAALILLIVAAGYIAGCAGQVAAVPAGTLAGTYTITVTGTSFRHRRAYDERDADRAIELKLIGSRPRGRDATRAAGFLRARLSYCRGGFDGSFARADGSEFAAGAGAGPGPSGAVEAVFGADSGAAFASALGAAAGAEFEHLKPRIWRSAAVTPS